MAIVNYSVTSPSLTTAVEMELSDADSERMIQWLMADTPYGTMTENVITDVPNPAWSPDQPDPLDPPEYIQQQSWVSRPATPEEAVIAYAQSLMNTSLQQAYQWDQQQAAAEAAASVPPITPVIPPTPVPPAP
jgi:hypothetical protein